jgi:hypothetical protein
MVFEIFSNIRDRLNINISIAYGCFANKICADKNLFKTIVVLAGDSFQRTLRLYNVIKTSLHLIFANKIERSLNLFKMIVVHAGDSFQRTLRLCNVIKTSLYLIFGNKIKSS